MYNFNIYDLYLSIANYFTIKNKHCILLSYEEAERIFSQPFNLVTIDLNGTTDGIMLVRYPDLFEELKENGRPLRSGLAIQSTWVCVEESILDNCLEKVDQFTGVLIYKQISNEKFKIAEYRKADKMHDYPYPTETLTELLNIQARQYWWLDNHTREIARVMDEIEDRNP